MHCEKEHDMNVLKMIWKGLVWSLDNLLWQPLKWTATTVYKICTTKKKTQYTTAFTLANVQQAAAKDLPQLTKLMTTLNAEKKKLTDKLNVVNADMKAAEALIKAASGNLGQHVVENRNKGGGNNNNNSQRKPKQPDNNQQNVAVADADFAS